MQALRARSDSSSRMPHGPRTGGTPWPQARRRSPAGGLMADRRPRVWLGQGPFGGVLAVHAVHLVEPLGLGVPGLELVVAERPGRRDPVDVLDLAEVLGPQAVEGGAVELGGAPDEVVDLGLERGAVAVVPGVLRDVPARRRTPRRATSSPSPAAGSRPARAAGSACPTGPGCGPGSPRRLRFR